ncbi:MAG: putative toxin-antitoxin system toxin component, PIN family [Armatimonadota bacterium]
MKVVLDTNTLVSGIAWTGPPAEILIALREGRHDLVISPDLLAELIRVLRYPRLRIVASHPSLPAIVEWLHRPEHIVIAQEQIRVIQSDPGDNLVLEAAVAGRAGVIVSGDRHLLRLGSFRGIPIITARACVARYL